MSGEGFLSRWSRRKRQAGEEPAPEPVAPEAAPAPAPEEEPPFDLASLPSLESLTAESDFTAFLHRQVPRALRDAALRKVWTLDPVIRDFIGPADYAWDFNAPDGVPGFSPNLAGDIGKMLAQAIGAPPPAAPEEEAAPKSLAEETPAGSAADALPATPPPEVPAADVCPLIQASAAEEPPVPAPQPFVGARRHGGALPV
jgi:hypothetical protein